MHNTCGMDGNTCISCSSSFNKYHQPNDCMVLLQFSPNLVPQLGWSVAWMDGIPVYWLCFRPIRPCPCTHKTGGTKENISTPRMDGWFCSSHQIWSHSLGPLMLGWIEPLCNNMPNHEDDLVGLQSSPNLVPRFKISEAWMDNTLVYWLCPRLVRPCPYTHKTCGMDGNISTPCGFAT